MVTRQRMTRSTLSHSLTPALTAWRDLVSNGPTGPGIDFTETNRTHACDQQFDAFLTDPSPETFRALRNADTLASYWASSAAVLLGPDSAIDSLQGVCSEMTEADAFDPTWLDRLAGSDPSNIRSLPNVSKTSSILPLHSSSAQMRW